MGIYYYFYKSDTDEKEFNSEKYSGIPYLSDYNLEEVNYYRDKCNSNNKKNNCFMCDCNDETRYKITRDKAREISKDMNANQDLFEDLMNEINQDYIWMRVSY